MDKSSSHPKPFLTSQELDAHIFACAMSAGNIMLGALALEHALKEILREKLEQRAGLPSGQSNGLADWGAMEKIVGKEVVDKIKSAHAAPSKG